MKALKYNLRKLLMASSLFFFSSSIYAQTSIYSVASGAWNDPSVWDCNCVPTASDQVFINPYNFIDITSNAYAGYIGIEPYGELNMNTPVSLFLTGDFDIIGKLNVTDGTLVINGDNEQYVDAGGNTVKFNNVTVNKPSGVNVTFYLSTYIINGLVDPISGNLVIEDHADNHFILNSESGSHASIGVLSSYSAIIGPVEVFTYLESGVSGDRDLAAPVNGVDFSMWADSINIYGATLPAGCMPWDTTCNTTAESYISDTYYEISSINEPINNTKGFELYLADDSSNFYGATLNSEGTVNSHEDIVVSVNTGWNLVGNPYVSDIDFNDVVKTGVTDYFYIYSTISGGYEWWDGVSQTGSSLEATNNGRIAMGQAFYVEGSGTLTFSQSNKTILNTDFIKTNEKIDESLYLTLKEENSGYYCQIALQGSTETNDGYDQGLDISNLSTGKEKCPTLTIDLGEKKVRKNYYQENGNRKEFELFTKFLHDGSYTISANNIPNFESYSIITLIDNLTGEKVDLNGNTSYEFYAEEGESNRFVLILDNTSAQNTSTAGIESLETNAVSTIFSNGELLINSDSDLDNVTIEIYSMNGQLIYAENAITLNSGQSVINGLEYVPGVHIVSIKCDELTKHEKIFLN